MQHRLKHPPLPGFYGGSFHCSFSKAGAVKALTPSYPAVMGISCCMSIRLIHLKSKMAPFERGLLQPLNNSWPVIAPAGVVPGRY